MSIKLEGQVTTDKVKQLKQNDSGCMKTERDLSSGVS